MQVDELHDLHIQEEHRMAYVGMTRARDLLYLTCLVKPPSRQPNSPGEPAGFVARLEGSPHCQTRCTQAA